MSTLLCTVLQTLLYKISRERYAECNPRARLYAKSNGSPDTAPGGAVVRLQMHSQPDASGLDHQCHTFRTHFHSSFILCFHLALLESIISCNSHRDRRLEANTEASTTYYPRLFH